jgi:hypothetical protein
MAYEKYVQKPILAFVNDNVVSESIIMHIPFRHQKVSVRPCPRLTQTYVHTACCCTVKARPARSCTGFRTTAPMTARRTKTHKDTADNFSCHGSNG